jgi:signal transduction histidine kinase
MAKSRDELKRAVPTLRSRFQSSRALIEKAHETATRVVEAADAMRALLHAENGTRLQANPQNDLWEAAAREILHGARERDRILGLLSHELRQALTAAIAAERLLQVTADRDTAERARGVLERQLLYLSRLVESLLEFSRVSLDPTTMSCHDVDVTELIGRTVESVESLIAERAQHLTIRNAAGAAVVTGDPTRLQQIFSNLLHNASRYTPAGGHIEITASVDDGWTQVDVHDDGHGIDPSELGAIFEPFTRRSVEGAGLGIGLSLAQRLTQLHGGTIVARSDGLDHGSTFTVRLPLTHLDGGRTTNGGERALDEQ